ncbi:formimidoylglutamate deiminase [Tamlana haliotis]|uniref:Formimidoylglutamate deiminase n=1 Tax=Pseudotamlana haliotis TaxID=2614804 RepID=A0A6N6MJ05_9FLAO|nr:formimidoylglutamate deiminase [Tamlana haliotis]KAB1068165.1 formimidoylglutamate deiminase [Tamlana haliotis]
MKSFLFKGLLTRHGWEENTKITIDNDGIITAIHHDSQNDNSEFINGFAIPGFQNAHSHSFQYAMAGLAERHEGTGVPDDFWSWRDAMYKLALSVNPDQFETIATMLYAEMARHGYTQVAEFHYVHHDKNGKKYNDLAEMGNRLVSAAKKVGIKITLVPIFYQKGGFGENPTKAQRRFISSTFDEYQKLYDASEQATKNYHGANIATGIHSMRGVEPELIKRIATDFPQNVPFHIHIAEQLKEIEDSKTYLNKRPVEWMLDNIEMTERFHLVHATHLNDREIKGIAKSGANVVLCPSTEGNLGDGIFPLKEFQEYGGHWSIGTDSHISLNPLEELRILDYGQRLTSHKRNIFYNPKQVDSGLFSIDMTLKSGRKAMNNYNTNYFRIGAPLDAVVYDAESPLLACTSLKNIASTLIYSSDVSMQLGTLVDGKWITKKEGYFLKKEVQRDFINTMKNLELR